LYISSYEIFFWRKNPFLLIYYSLPLIYLPRLFLPTPGRTGGLMLKATKNKMGADFFGAHFAK